MGIRTDRVAALIALIEQEGEAVEDAIRFIRVRDTVHVLARRGDRPQRHKELFGEGDGEALMRMMLGEEWSICGVRFVRHRKGFEGGAQLLSHFPDEQLCFSCHEPFGIEHGHLIFDANQDDGRDPDEAGRLGDDLITKGQTLR